MAAITYEKVCALNLVMRVELRRLVGVFVGVVVLLTLVRAWPTNWREIPVWIDYYLVLLSLCGLPIGLLYWLVEKTEYNGLPVGMFSGIIYRLLKGMLLLLVGVYGLGIVLMIS